MGTPTPSPGGRSRRSPEARSRGEDTQSASPGGPTGGETEGAPSKPCLHWDSTASAATIEPSTDSVCAAATTEPTSESTARAPPRAKRSSHADAKPCPSQHPAEPRPHSGCTRTRRR